MKVRMEEKNGVLVAWLSGELDHHAADSVRQELDSAMNIRNFQKLVLDMSRLTFMDSSGIGVILGRYKKLKDRGRRLAVRGLSEKMDRIMRLAGLYAVVDRE